MLTGKGRIYKKGSTKEFNENFDSINWKSKKSKKPSGNLVEWAPKAITNAELYGINDQSKGS